MAEMDIVPYIGTRTPADFDTLFDELEAARGSSASLSDAIAEKADNATTLSGYGITDAYTKTEIDTALSGKQDALSQSQLAAANSGITAAKLTADETVLGEVINGGAAGTKNLLIYTLSTLQTQNNGSAYGFSWSGNVCTTNRGVTFTVNSDMSIRVQANATNDVWFLLENHSFDVGTWMLSGCPADGGTSKYYIESDNINARDIGSGVQISAATNLTDNIYIIVKSGQSFDLTFKPMLCRKALYDVNPDYEPYAPAKTNVEITPALIEQVDGGSKNIADMSKSSFTTLTKDSVTVTLSGDTITASGTGGTATNNFFNIFYVSNALLVPSGTWVISLVGTGINNFRVEEYDNAHPDVVKGDFGQPLTVTVPNDATQSYIRIASKPSTNCAGTFNLMICTAADWAISQKFVPYRPSWQEMYDMILALQNGTRSVPALAMSAEPEVEPETGEEEMR